LNSGTKICFYQPDEGEVCIQEQPVTITSPHDAIKKGVGADAVNGALPATGGFDTGEHRPGVRCREKPPALLNHWVDLKLSGDWFLSNGTIILTIAS
jgi:hypothetical protein